MKKALNPKQSDYRIFDNMLEGVQVVDYEWRYLYVNDAVAKQGKSSKQDLLGARMMDIYPGIEKTEMFHFLERCMLDRTNQSMTNEFDFPDGSKGYFDLIFTPVDEGVMIMSINITDRKLLEIELSRLNGHLEEKVQERTEELSRALESEKRLNRIAQGMVSTISHEFKTPLVAIKFNVNVLENYNDNQHAGKRLTIYEHIRDAVQGMFDTLEDYLTIDKLKKGIVSSDAIAIDIPQFMKLKMDKLGILLKTDQQFDYSHEGNERFIFDRSVLRSIVTNLISNAIKYSDKDIVIRTSIRNGKFMLEVKDQGIGIPEKDIKNLYSKYYRATNAKEYRGTGLGLNIVKKYVDILHGDIEVKSEENKGSTFKVMLPVR